MNPKVSVIIPIYNSDKFLTECLDSVLAQSLQEIEVICIDDGSTDTSMAILERYKCLDERIRVFRQTHAGSGQARNLGLSVAQGEFLSFMDADDYYPNEYTLEALYTNLKESGLKICGGGVSLNKDGVIISGKNRGEDNHFKEKGVIRFYDVQNDYGYQKYMFSHRLIKENYITFPPYLRFQDPPFLVKSMIAAESFFAIPEDTYCYRLGHQNIQWTQEKVCDLVRGIMDVLILSRKNGLKQLHKKCINRINGEYLGIVLTSLKEGNESLLYLLALFNSRINRDWLDEKDDYIIMPLKRLLEGASFKTNANMKYTEVLAENKRLKEEIRNIKNSKTYKLGCFVTFIPRRLRMHLR